MSAPAARIAEIVAEGRRLERPNEPGPKGQRAVFWAEHASLFLAVAEAAVEWEEAEDAYDHSFDPTPDLVIWRVNASLALRAAVRGEERPDE